MSEYVHGLFNVVKCCKYLRGRGIEISAATEAEWRDAERVDRYLHRITYRPVSQCWEWQCAEHHVAHILTKRGQRRASKKAEQAAGCPTCGKPFVYVRSLWNQYGDGRVEDRRNPSEHWKPLPLFVEEPT